MVVTTMTLILILSASAYITAGAVTEVGGDVAAWRKGKEPPSHQRWLKNHERKMAKLGKSGSAPSAAPGYAERILDNNVQRWADRSAQKTRENKQFLDEHGAQVASDKVQRKIRRHDAWEKRRRDLADLFGAAWDNTAEKVRERQAHDRNDRIGPVLLTDLDADTNGEPESTASTDVDRTDEPATASPSGIRLNVTEDALRILADEARRQGEHDEQQDRRNDNPASGPQTDHYPGQQRSPSSNQPPPAPEPGPVQAHAERVYPAQPELTAIEGTPATGADGELIEDAELVDDPEVVEGATPSGENAPLATVHNIRSKKEGTGMALEGGYTGVADKMDSIVEHLTQFNGVTTSTYDALSGEKWTGEPMDLIEKGNADLKRALDNLSKAASMIRKGGNAVQDSYTANSFVGSDTSVRHG